MRLANDIYEISAVNFKTSRSSVADTRLFEGQFPINEGMRYNSYLILDKKIALLDTVAKGYEEQWLKEMKEILGLKKPDFLIIHHMEPDHSANIKYILQAYPDLQIVCNQKSQIILNQFFNKNNFNNYKIVADGQELNLGNKKLKFIFAPMVHWPEVMVSFENESGTLFSADAFGKFGSTDSTDDWLDEARRYYFGIVGKYGMQVQMLFKKLANLQINYICPLHGPILSNNIDYYINLYNVWSSYEAESQGVFIAYTSIYGHTKEAAEYLNKKLKDLNLTNVEISDLSDTDLSFNIAKAFKYKKVIFATTTYNAEIFPKMKFFIESLIERGFKNKIIGFIENGSWAPVAAKYMFKMFESSKNLTFLENTITIKSSLNDENIKQIDKMAEEIINK